MFIIIETTSKNQLQKKKLTENVKIDKIEVQDYLSDFEEGGDRQGEFISYEGPVRIALKLIDQEGQQHSVLYMVDVKARCDYEWDVTDEPTGWNYKTDQPTYTSHQYIAKDNVLIQSVSFVSGEEINIDGDEIPIQNAAQILGRDGIRELLNPEVTRKAMNPGFERKFDSMEPPSSEPDYPEND